MQNCFNNNTATNLTPIITDKKLNQKTTFEKKNSFSTFFSPLLNSQLFSNENKTNNIDCNVKQRSNSLNNNIMLDYKSSVTSVDNLPITTYCDYNEE